MDATTALKVHGAARQWRDVTEGRFGNGLWML